MQAKSKAKTKTAKSKMAASAKLNARADDFTYSEQAGSEQNVTVNEVERVPKVLSK